MVREVGGAQKIRKIKTTKKSKKTNQLLSENSSARITRSKSVISEKVQEGVTFPLEHCNSRNTRSKSKADIIIPLQTISPLKTRSKSEKIPNITINSDPNHQQSPNSFNKVKSQCKNLIISTIQFVKLHDYNVDSIVLAKQKYSTPWPAKVLKIEKNRVFVYFFGDKRSGFVSKFEIYDFFLSVSAIKSTIASKKVHRSYYTGIAEVELSMGIPSEKSLLI